MESGLPIDHTTSPGFAIGDNEAGESGEVSLGEAKDSVGSVYSITERSSAIPIDRTSEGRDKLPVLAARGIVLIGDGNGM